MKMRTAFGLAAACLLIVSQLALASNEPIVIGQSLPVSAVADVGRSVKAATEEYVRQVNAAGGISGRQVKLVTLDDVGDPQRHAANLRDLVEKHKAIALLNCLGDAACRAAAGVVGALRVPMIGPMSGARALRQPRSRYLFPIRAGHERETAALAVQLRTIGIARLGILTQSAGTVEPVSAVITAMARQGIAAVPVRIEGEADAALDAALAELKKGNHDCILLDVGPSTINRLAERVRALKYEWPPLLTSLATPTLTSMAALFRDRVIGFTSVVPNPEVSTAPLVQALHRLADQSGTPSVISFEGLEAYVNIRVCIEALKRAGVKLDAEHIVSSLESLRGYDLGDYVVSFGSDRPSGSDWVELGMRLRDGSFVR